MLYYSLNLKFMFKKTRTDTHFLPFRSQKYFKNANLILLTLYFSHDPLKNSREPSVGLIYKNINNINIKKPTPKGAGSVLPCLFYFNCIEEFLLHCFGSSFKLCLGICSLFGEQLLNYIGHGCVVVLCIVLRFRFTVQQA